MKRTCEVSVPKLFIGRSLPKPNRTTTSTLVRAVVCSLQLPNSHLTPYRDPDSPSPSPMTTIPSLELSQPSSTTPGSPPHLHVTPPSTPTTPPSSLHPSSAADDAITRRASSSRHTRAGRVGVRARVGTLAELESEGAVLGRVGGRARPRPLLPRQRRLAVDVYPEALPGGGERVEGAGVHGGF